MAERFTGFEPVYDKDSKVLILGSFPSVLSRKNDFYYGNPQNRFWKMISSYFNDTMPENNEQKKELLRRRRVALWDVVSSCEIVGSADGKISAYETADVGRVLKAADIQMILLNGKKALSVFEENYKNCGVEYRVMPSTSPANPRYDYGKWKEALDAVFRIDR